MKRITVAITLKDDYVYGGALRKIQTAMVNAAVAKATEEDKEIAAIMSKTGTVRKVQVL
jgi:hypothetical protein